MTRKRVRGKKKIPDPLCQAGQHYMASVMGSYNDDPNSS